ncbi:MAG: hypothetical protein ACR5LG_05165 [Sodalis sp. (in: enterobacteria)]|uniref:hypothetical protein n=1 Tax=Sodalis sp. (in: enterobacteria) TaxID=1898979 RepID=UPI003F304BCC
MMRKAIATVALSGTLPERLEAIARAGFAAVEIFADDLQTFPGSARDIRRLTEALDLDVVVVQPLRDYVDAPRQRKRKRATNAGADEPARLSAVTGL